MTPTITRRLAELRRMARAGLIRDFHYNDYTTREHGAVFVYQMAVPGGWSPVLTAEGRA